MGINMSYLERAITDGHAKLTGEGKQQKILYVAVNHTERYAGPEEQVRAGFWAELPPRVAATPRRSRWTRRPRRAINQAERLVWRLATATRRRWHPLRRGRRSYRLLKAIAEYSVVPDRLEPMLDLFKALLKKPSDELRWSIQSKDLAPVISLGLASDKPSTKKLAGECKDLLLKMGFFDFLNL
jgi:hypothetical protein